MSDPAPHFVTSYLEDAVRDFPDRICLKVEGKEISYRDFYDSLSPLAEFFIARGVASGKKVALYLDDDLLMIRSIFALWALGATVVPMNIKYTAEKLGMIARNIVPDIGFYTERKWIDPGVAMEVYELDFREEAHRSELSIEPHDSESMALIMFTSGSTGLPKGVPITHSALYGNTRLTAARMAITSTDRIFVNTPPYTTSSLIHILTLFSQGGSVVIERGFLFGSNIWQQILVSKCTGFGGVPVHFTRILAALSKSNERGQLRFLMNSGEHLPVPVIGGILEKLPGVQIYCVYGLTEVAGRLCILDPTYLDSKRGSVGRPLDGMKVSIRNDSGAELPAGQEGQVFVSGPLLTKGYVNNPEVNKREFTAWGFATGDYGYLDDEGFLFLKGRKDDIIKVGGEKVSLKMIEDALHGYDDFAEFAVFAGYDANLGNVPVLQYVLKPGCSFDRGKFVRAMSVKLPATHIPVKFDQVGQIERTSSGKVVRRPAVKNDDARK